MASVFEDNKNTPEIPEVDPNKDYLSEYVGEGKKYPEGKDLAFAYANADRHIKVLEAERAAEKAEAQRLRDEAASLKTLQSVLDRLNSEDDTTVRNKDGHKPPEPEDRSSPKTPTPGDIEKLVLEVIENRNRQSTAQTNESRVVEVLKANFGPGWRDVALQKAQEAGVSASELDTLSKTNPKLVFKVLDARENPSATPNAAPNARTPFSSDSKKKNFKYFEEIRKSKGSEAYFSPAVQSELFRAAKEMGEDFFKD